MRKMGKRGIGREKGWRKRGRRRGGIERKGKSKGEE